MSDELERLARQAKVDGPRSTMPDWQHLDAFHQACTPAVILALLSERRELVAGLKRALRLADNIGSVIDGSKMERIRKELCELEALADRIGSGEPSTRATCTERSCQRELGHRGLHMSRSWNAATSSEIIDEWGAVDPEDLAARIAPNQPTPRYEYQTVEGPRKGPTPAPPDGDGWERDPDAGRPGQSWDRFDAHEEYYWRRRIAPNQDGEK